MSTDRADTPARINCLQCRRPVGLCVCDAIGRVDNRIGVTIVQHPRERHHPFGTARLAHLALRDVQVQVAWIDADGNSALPLHLPPGTALLYPSPLAVPLAELAPRHLLVLDGTWPMAQGLYRDNPWMAALPHVALAPDQPSNYRIRREPAAHCLSTIESIAAALRVLEPDTAGVDGLLAGFTALVDRQLAHRSTAPPQARRKTRGPMTARAVLVARWPRVVVASGELDGEGRLCRWTGIRPHDGALFDHRCDGSAATEGLAAAWQAWTRQDDPVAVWSETPTRAFRAATGLCPLFVPLKSVWCNQERRHQGTLRALVTRLGLPTEPVPVSGGAAGYLADAVALARHLAEPASVQ